MADDIDIANEQLQKTMEATIKTLREASISPPKNYTGKCIWCSYLIIDLRRWCSAECRDEWTEARDKWK